MGNAFHPELKGFDAYEVKLGDELRGERASKGKTLLDVQRDLRLRADLIDAIENADASRFTAPGFAAGYVRSYARYLGMDPDDVFRRFCEESGFQTTSEASVEPTIGKGAARPIDPGKRIDDLVINNRFAPANARAARLDLGATLRGLASVAALCALVAGLGFGGWTVLQNLQRVGFAPLPDAPDVLVSAPDIQAPAGISDQVEVAAVVGPSLPATAPRLSLAEIYASQEFSAPVIEPRDGPISSIDPQSAGVYGVALVEDVEVMVDEPTKGGSRAQDFMPDDFMSAEMFGLAVEDFAPVPDVIIETIKVVATADAWVRVRDSDRRTLFTGILGAGDRFALPADVEHPVLRAGNAGAVYLMVGNDAFGPLGAGPEVAKDVQLTAEAIRAVYPLADATEVGALQDALTPEIKAAAIAHLPTD